MSPAAHAASAAPYYRCRFPSEYALANRVHHPLNVTLRQDALLEPLDGWLASKFEPCHLGGTINELAAASVAHEIDPGNAELDTKITDCDRKLAQYRATLEPAQTRPPLPGGSPRPRPNAPGTRPPSAPQRPGLRQHQ